jgi:hypothetical protein
VSSGALAYHSAVYGAIKEAFPAWDVKDHFPAPEEQIAFAQIAFVELLEEGDDTLSDGSGGGAVLAVLLASATVDRAAARQEVAEAAEAVREALRSKRCQADRFTVSYNTRGQLYGADCSSATIGIEKKIVLR